MPRRKRSSYFWAAPLVRAPPLFELMTQLVSFSPLLPSPIQLVFIRFTHPHSRESTSWLTATSFRKIHQFSTVVTHHRLPVFQQDKLKEVLCGALNEVRKTILIFAYVIMIDHLHLLTSRPSTTSDVLRVVKGLTARRVILFLKENNLTGSLAKLQHQTRERNYRYSLWQTEKNALPAYTEELFMQKLNYIHNNPVRAGLVERAVDYRWSSARIWAGCPREDEPLQVDKDLIYWRRRQR